MRRIILVCTFLYLLTFVASSASVELVVPNDFGELPGDVSNCYPFGSHPPPYTSYPVPRYQQVYDSRELTSLIGLEIVGIAFRVNEAYGDVAGGYLYENINIRLSTTAKLVDGLSVDFASNVGPDETVVFDAPYVLPDLEGNQPINPFDMTFSFSTPFTYSGGNLLLDIRMPVATHASFYLDATYVWSDSVSRAYHLWGYDSPLRLGTIGLITEFTAIPEPATLCLLGLGAVMLRRKHG